MPKATSKKSDAPTTVHTQKAENANRLPGAGQRPIKVVMMGAGSGFTPRLTEDIFNIPDMPPGEIALVDIDRKRLTTMKKLIETVFPKVLARGWKVTAHEDRRQALKGAHYLINSIEVSGLKCVRAENDIPMKYGVNQCIGDTIGPGGLFKALRTGPVWLDILRDAERLCPDAIVLNYTNPMSILTLCAGRASNMSVVGLCHSVQGTTNLLANRLGIPISEINWECAGINHLAWVTKFEKNGKDLYPELFKLARRDLAGKDPKCENWDIVRKDMMLNFGAFITESSGHLSEYLPYYRKRKDTLDKYCRPGYCGGTSFYADNWPIWRKKADDLRDEMIRTKKVIVKERSWEYGSWIVESREKNVPVLIHGNVMNCRDGAGPLISNLPMDGVVEVACMIDGNGIQPTRFGALPAQMAGICASNMASFDLAAQAVLERSKEAAIHALMLDPLTAAVCSPSQIRKMALELFAADKDYLPGYR